MEGTVLEICEVILLHLGSKSLLVLMKFKSLKENWNFVNLALTTLNSADCENSPTD